MKEGDKIVIINEKSKCYGRVFEVLAISSDDSVCVNHEYFHFRKDEYVLEILYNSKLYEAMR